MKVMTVVLGLVFSLSTNALALDQYPQSPQPSLTPGALCKTPSARRYPEKIAYCERDVDGETKDEVVQRYDATFGYQVARIGRHKFKIDHYIPLCMGGSNEESNLWPQHPSVYEITDPLEPVLCQKMAEGKLKQADAVQLIKKAKANLNQVRSIMESVQAL
jgi:hypothetical protein